jgi:hypothetical protein
VREIFAIEEDDGVGWRVAGLRTGGYDRRMRTRGIVHVPLLAGYERSIGVAEIVIGAWRGVLGECGRG